MKVERKLNVQGAEYRAAMPARKSRARPLPPVATRQPDPFWRLCAANGTHHWQSKVHTRRPCSQWSTCKWRTERSAPLHEQQIRQVARLTFAMPTSTEKIIGAIQCTFDCGPKLVHAKPKRPIASSGATDLVSIALWALTSALLRILTP